MRAHPASAGGGSLDDLALKEVDSLASLPTHQAVAFRKRARANARALFLAVTLDSQM